MAEFVIVGGKTKRVNARFGGESAHRQHTDEGRDRAHVVLARRKSDQRFLATTLQDLELDVAEQRAQTNICTCMGVQPVRDGVVRENGITLVYAGGKLLAAHCG
jgi:hypothetical protein